MICNLAGMYGFYIILPRLPFFDLFDQDATPATWIDICDGL